MFFMILITSVLIIFYIWMKISEDFDVMRAEKEQERVASLSPKQRKLEMEQSKKEMEKQQQKSNELHEGLHLQIYGPLSSALICPHCQTKGFIRKKSSTRIKKTRVNSVAARLVGLGTNTESQVTQMHCDNCDVTWDIQ